MARLWSIMTSRKLTGLTSLKTGNADALDNNNQFTLILAANQYQTTNNLGEKSNKVQFKRL